MAAGVFGETPYQDTGGPAPPHLPDAAPVPPAIDVYCLTSGVCCLTMTRWTSTSSPRCVLRSG